MKEIKSLTVLKKALNENENVWLLLYKKGSGQSECAQKNYQDASAKMKDNTFLYADVSEVRDIHPEYNVRSVPTLLQFKKGKLANLTKGCHTAAHFIAIFENSVFIPQAAEEGKPAKRVTVYSTPTCTWCTAVKRHLDANHINYRDVDVSKDQKAAEEMVKRSGQQGVPQIDINGQVVVGFDRTKINQLLGIN